MYGAVAPMLSVIVTDEEMKELVINGIEGFLSGPYCYGSWEDHVNLANDSYVALLERLRVAYNIEV